MRGGHNVIPDSVKIAEGTFQKCKQKQQKVKVTGVPECPFEPGSIAHDRWQFVVAGLKRLRLIDEIDGSHLEGYCRLYQIAKEADEVVDRDGVVVEGRGGAPIKNPAILISVDAWNKVRLFGNDLGLCHLSRQRMASDAEASDDALEAKFIG